MPDTLVIDKRITAREVAEILGIHRETVYLWARTGRIPCHKLGRHRLRFSKADIERWLRQHTTGKF